MWKLVENSTNEKPETIDETSSNSVVYVRKNFEEVPSYDSEGEVDGTHWQYLENEVPKADWETYKSLLDTQEDLTDVQLAICELYEMMER